MKKLLLIYFALILNIIGLFAGDNPSNLTTNKSIYDICNILLSDKPIISLDLLFGNEINAKTLFICDKEENSIKYEYKFNEQDKLIEKKIIHVFNSAVELRKYEYNDMGKLEKITEIQSNYTKILEFKYYPNGKLKEFIEIIQNENSNNEFQIYDYLLYKLNSNGNIFEVRGITRSILGLKENSEILKVYDYDEQNRLKSIRNFRNPDESIILRFDEFVKCSN